MNQKLVSIRRAKEHDDEELLFRIMQGIEVLLTEYVKNCKDFQIKFLKHLKIGKIIEKGEKVRLSILIQI